MSVTEDREYVRTHLGVNMVVEAGAGTGKTTLLIERLCFALLAQGIAAPRLVALTFTEKAAAEIKTRLMVKLQTVLSAARENTTDLVLTTLREEFGVADEEIISRAERALAQLDRSQIGTIHSFCADILRAYPLEAGLTPNAEVDKGPRAQHIFEGLWNQFLDKELGENAPRATQWKQVLARASLTDLYRVALEMCSGKIHEYHYLAQKDFLAQVCATRAQTAAHLSGAFLDAKKKPRVIEKALQQASRRFLQAQTWLQTGEMPAAEEETIVIKSIPKDWDGPTAEDAKALCRFAAQVDPFVQAWVLSVYDLLDNFVQEVRARYSAEGILSFDDLIVKARDLLKTNMQVRHKAQEKYDVLYIDEFQDTDPAQGELLLYLAEQPDNEAQYWHEVKLIPGKLFVVGDPKQSIYRFRGADITAYQLFTDLILKQGGEKAYLRQNFRSAPDIITLTNEVCGRVMQAKHAFQPAYEPIFPSKSSGVQAAQLAVICASAEQKVSADDYRHNQAEYIAKWIKENVGHLILSDGRKLAYSDIAILSRSSTTLWPYTDALRRYGFPFSVEEDRDFYHRQEVTDFLNFLRVLEDRQDRISLVGVMRSPLGALTDEEIYQAARRNELDFTRPCSYEKQERLFALLRRFAARVGRQPLPELLRGILQETFLSEACALSYEGARSLANLQRLVALAQRYCLQTPVTLGQFLSRVEELMTQESGRLTSLTESEANQAINVMTVHKSKGLEFPVVILVDISKKEIATASKRPAHLYSWNKNLHGFLIGKYADINLAWLEEEQREHSRCEEVRILYVALNRAKEKLLIVGNDTVDGASMAAHFMRAGYFPPVEERPASIGAAKALQVVYVPYVSPDKFIYNLHTPPPTQTTDFDISAWRAAYEKRQAEYVSYTQEKRVLSPSQIERPLVVDATAAELGGWTHAALQRRHQYPQEKLSTSIKAVAPGSTPEQQMQIENILNKFYTSPAYQHLTAMTVQGTEIPFVLSTADGIRSGVIDLLTQDAGGTIWVLDYKTDKIKSTAATAAAHKYAAQLAIYAQAAQKMYPQAAVKTAIIFVRTGQLIQIS